MFRTETAAMPHIHIRKDDTVEVLSGDDKGKRGRVLRVLVKEGKVVVEGMNRVYKHLRPNRQNNQGGRLSKEMPIQLSNVALIDPTTNKPTRVGVRYLPDGSKERFAKKSGTSLGKVAPARAKYAKK
jgi:large subunit ribosomal protein L24